MGLFMKKTKPDEELVATGLKGRATVLHVDLPRGSLSMSMSQGKFEEMARGDVTPVRRKVRLRVELEGREPYEVETKLNIPMMMAGRLVAGSSIAVLVDPGDPKNLAADWSAGIQAGSPTAMLNDNPMATAVLQGMGIDPQVLAQQMEQAQAQAQAYMAWAQQHGQMPPGVAVPGQMPPGAVVPGQMVPGQMPPGWVPPPGWPTPQVPQPGAVPAPQPAAEGQPPAPTAGPSWPQPQPWPSSTDNVVGPTSEDKPEDD
jgi:hypothetical protein